MLLDSSGIMKMIMTYDIADFSAGTAIIARQDNGLVLAFGDGHFNNDNSATSGILVLLGRECL